MALMTPILEVKNNYNGIITNNIEFVVKKNPNDSTALKNVDFSGFIELEDGTSRFVQEWNKEGSFLIRLTNFYGKKIRVVGRIKDNTGNIKTTTSNTFRVNNLPQVVNSKVDVIGDGEVNNPNRKFSKSIKISWKPALDKDNHKLMYSLDYIENNGVGSICAYYGPNTSYTIDLSSEEFKKARDGKDLLKMQCRVKVFDMISPDGKIYEYSDFHSYERDNIYTPFTLYLKKKSTSPIIPNIPEIEKPPKPDPEPEPIPPKAPTKILPTSQHFENSISINWDKCENAYYYYIELKSLDSNKILKKIKTENLTYSISNLQDYLKRGEQFSFYIKSIDYEGLESDFKKSPVYWINRMPNDIKNFKVDSTLNVYEKDVPLSWNKSSDPDGDEIEYIIEYKEEENEEWKEVANHDSYKKALNYTHDISSIKEGTYIYYRIKAKENFASISSNWTYLDEGSILKNSKPSPPKLIYPNVNLKIYEKKPRLLIKMGTDVDKDNQILNIYIDNKKYNSKENDTLFSTSILKDKETVLFIPPVDLDKNSRIYLSSEDIHGAESEKYQCLINFNQEPLEYLIPNNTFVTQKIIEDLRAKVNEYREAYDMPLCIWKNNFSNRINKITEKYFTEIIDALLEISNKLNDFTKKEQQKRVMDYVGSRKIITLYVNIIYDIFKYI